MASLASTIPAYLLPRKDKPELRSIAVLINLPTAPVSQSRLSVVYPVGPKYVGTCREGQKLARLPPRSLSSARNDKGYVRI